MFGLLKPSHTVEEIHAEIDSAEDRLLDAADKLLKELNIPTESRVENKGAKLKALGFTASETVKQAEKLAESRAKQKAVLVATKSEADLIQYYKQTYPFQKFLSIKELDRICEKYNLIHAPVKNYIKDVPEKNVIEIERAQPLKAIDLEKDSAIVSWDKDKSSHYYNDYSAKLKELLTYLGHPDGVFTMKQAADLYNLYAGNTYKVDKVDLGSNTWLYSIWCGLGKIGHYNYNAVSLVSRTGYFVAAPKSHFNLEGLTKKTKNGFFSVTTTEVKDPIVFEYCKGDMVRVITKWGTEDDQSYLDSSLVNEKMN